MSDSKARKMSPEVIAALSKYEERFRRALNGDRIELSSIGVAELERIHLEVFGSRQAMTQCCGGSRTVSERVSPLAKAYFTQINGSDKKTTGLAESLTDAKEQIPTDETEAAEISTGTEKTTNDVPKKRKAVKSPKIA